MISIRIGKKFVEGAKSKKGFKGFKDNYLKKRVDGKYKNNYRWLEWIIKGKHPYSFVADRYNRKTLSSVLFVLRH